MLLPLLLLAVLPVRLSAQPAHALSIEEAVRRGLEADEGLHAAYMGHEAAVARSLEARAARLPTVSAGAGYTRLSEVPPFEVDLPLPPPAPDRFLIAPAIPNQYNVRLSVQQPLFTGGRLESASRAGRLQALAAGADVEQSGAELVFRIREAYWTLYRSAAFREAADQNLRQVEAHLRDLENLRAGGLAMQSEVSRVEVQRSNALLIQITAGNAVHLARTRLNSLIGLPLDAPAELTSRPAPGPEEPAGLEALVRLALERRPELEALALRAEAGRAGERAARAGFYPQLFLTGNYYVARPNPRILPAADRFENTWDVGVALSMDVWNWNRTRHQVSQAHASRAQLEDRLAQLRDAVTLEVTQAYLTLLESRQRIEVAARTIAQAEEGLLVTGERFRNSLALSSDLLDAEVALFQARTAHTQALTDHEIARARLERATGAPPSP